HLPLYYEVVYGLTAAQAGLALIPVAAISVAGAAFAGRSMTRARHYKRVPIAGAALAAVMGLVMALATPLPLWALLTALGIFSAGLGTTFPITVVSIQNAVARAQVGTATGAMNFFRALMASFMVAAFTTILMIALGMQLAGGEASHTLAAVPSDQMIAGFRYLFGAAALLLGGAALCLILMEERPLAGPDAVVAVEMAE
ncbi:MAG: major facilitator superfamily 1, partial [Tardiphaga sp.]|nr:major facilitator superfamily 1 [Tardiphaga sp.]